jgi:serine/threonine-protein phosphatase 2B regulatory subunit
MDPQMVKKIEEFTTYEAKEIAVLFENFKKLSSLRRSDGIIDRSEFQTIMGGSGSESSTFLDALFNAMDRDGSGGIDFSEFVIALAIYQNKAKSVPESDKQHLFFKLYDLDGDKEISQKDLSRILRSCFESNGMRVGDAEINAIVQATFQKFELTPRGTIDFGSYCKSAFK